MTAPTSTRLGTRRLSEVACHVVQPAKIKTTNWPAVEAKCRDMGIGFDEWQRGAGRLILSKTADGKYAATVGGVGMSLPRQVGKTYLIGAIVFALCILFPGLTVIWTAHHSRTAGETFLSMQGFARRKKIAPYIEAVFKGSGDEEIRFCNGSRILFGARERGFGRGFSDVGVLVCDEAQILTERALDNMLATMNTAQNPLPIFMGTPPKPEDPSEAFRRMRTEALAGESSDSVWIECSADEKLDPDDRAQWAKANPSFPHRTPLTSMLRLRKKLSVESWLREGLGLWDSKDGHVFDMAAWERLKQTDAAQPSRVALVVDVSPDREWSCVGVAGKCESVDDTTLVMCLSGRGTEWVATKVAELVESRDVINVGLVTTGQAKALQPDLTQAGVEFEKLTSQDMSAACSAFREAVKHKRIAHVGQGELDTALGNARVRRTGETDLWDRRDTEIDISPLVACSAAFYRWSLLQSEPYDLLDSIH
jgi:phage terminase large subunit-like protein